MAQINLYRARGFDIDRYNAVAQAEIMKSLPYYLFSR
jgi:hypothetical protein